MRPIDAGRAGLAQFNTSQGSHDKVATVRAGEKTLAEVANRLNVELNALMLANPRLRNPNALKAGQEINLPQQPEIPEANLLTMPAISGAGASRTGVVQTAPPLFADPLLKSLAQLQLNQGYATASLADGVSAGSVRAVAASPSPEPSGAQPAAATRPTPAPPRVPAAAAPTVSTAQQQIAAAIQGGYYAGSNNSNFSYATGVAQGGSLKTDQAAANLSDLQDAFYAAVHQGDVAGAHRAIDQMNTVRASIGLNAFWSPVTDFQIVQNAGGELGEEARAFAEANPGVKDLNQFVNTGSALLSNAGNGTLGRYQGSIVTLSGGTDDLTLAALLQIRQFPPTDQQQD